jgi:hypothetical protein
MGSPYATMSATLSQDEYETYKNLLESELDKYANG